jgi:hypothetical protein
MPNPIAEYHDLLTPDLAAESQALLDDQLRQRGLIFGDRPLCTVLRPRFMNPGTVPPAAATGASPDAGLPKAYAAAIADPGFRAQFGLEAWKRTHQQRPRLRGAEPYVAARPVRHG